MLDKCTKCNLHLSRSKIVAGRGSEKDSKILFIGEAPGISEDILGRAFIGDNGKILDKMLDKAGIPQGLCYFTNTVLCRPCDGKRLPNREPSKDEVFACMPNVQQVIKKIALEGVIVVGAIARKFYGNKFPGVPVLEVTHPAVILRKGGVACSLFYDNVHKMRAFYERIAHVN